jgi:hypothetical protein
MKAHINRPGAAFYPFSENEMKNLSPQQREKIISWAQMQAADQNKQIQNAFIMGAKAISKIAGSDYKPDIDAAKDYDSLRAAVSKLFDFLGKGDSLK